MMPQLIALGLVEDLPLPGTVDRDELIGGFHDVRRVHRQVPVDALDRIPLLVLATLVQIKEPLAAVVVLPRETGGAGGGDVPRAWLDGGGVVVVGAHGVLLKRAGAGGLPSLLSSRARWCNTRLLSFAVFPARWPATRRRSCRPRDPGWSHWQAEGSWPAWLAGSSWKVEWATSKWPCRHAWSVSSMAALRPLASTSGSTTTCADSTGSPDVIVHACRSCTPTTPSSAIMCVRTSVRSMLLGLASSRTSTASRSSRQVRGRMSTATASDAMGSARSKPVAATTTPVMITAIAPNVSEATSRNAPRTFRLSAWPCRSSSSETPLPASAITPKITITVGLTSGGEASRRAASTMINTAMPNSTSAFTVAARISARAYPKVRRSVAGRAAT